MPGEGQTIAVLELWGLGDAALSIPFLRRAAARFRVEVAVRPANAPLLRMYCPEAEIVPCDAPWTAFQGKYPLSPGRWKDVRRLISHWRKVRPAVGVSGRPDPRDHFVVWASRAKQRFGFGAAGSGCLLTHSLDHLPPHRADAWNRLAKALNLPEAVPDTTAEPGDRHHIVIHTGAAQPTRRWPLDRYREIVRRMRNNGLKVSILCGPDEISEWNDLGESASCPKDVESLIAAIRPAGRFIGNDSGPGHVAALAGLPTFTIFGAMPAERFSPIHPEAEWIDGKPCPHKPCFDACRFPRPHCILDLDTEEVWRRIAEWLQHTAPQTAT